LSETAAVLSPIIRVPLCSLAFFFSSFFPHSRRTFRFPSISFPSLQKNKASLKVRTNDKSLRYTSLVFSLFSLSLCLVMCSFLFFCFCFFCFVTSQIFFVALALFFLIFTHLHAHATPHQQRREKNTMVKITKSTNSLSRLSLSLFSFLFFFERRRPSFSSLLLVVVVGREILSSRSVSEFCFLASAAFVGKYLLTHRLLSLFLSLI
jgi:hypothetical protein